MSSLQLTNISKVKCLKTISKSKGRRLESISMNGAFRQEFRKREITKFIIVTSTWHKVHIIVLSSSHSQFQEKDFKQGHDNAMLTNTHSKSAIFPRGDKKILKNKLQLI